MVFIRTSATFVTDYFLHENFFTESGVVVLQIGDENLHYVRGVLDEVFGPTNFCALVTFSKTSSASSELLAGVSDYLLLYAKDVDHLKYRQLYKEKAFGGEGASAYNRVQFPDGTRRSLTSSEKADISVLPKGSKIYRLDNLTSQRPPGDFPIELDGKTFRPKRGYWKTGEPGMEALKARRRLEATDTGLYYVRYLDDFPVFPVTNLWDDTGIAGFASDKKYVVETSTKVVERCLLMTTDPGDLVLDITCGSGTTAFVAEEWGRRWITCDTSRVSLTLAKQRLMAAVFDYYELAHPHEGVGSGFKYKTVPHITLKSIANNEPADQEVLYDQPFVDNSRARVTGPFTVEAVPAPVVKPLVEIKSDQPADESIARSGETLRQAEWRDELLKSGIRGKKGQYILFSRVEPLPGTRWLHAEAETKPNDKGADRVKDPEGIYGKPQRVVISFGPEHAPLEQKQVELAIEEAQTLVPKPKIIVFAAFQFDPKRPRTSTRRTGRA